MKNATVTAAHKAGETVSGRYAQNIHANARTRTRTHAHTHTHTQTHTHTHTHTHTQGQVGSPTWSHRQTGHWDCSKGRTEYNHPTPHTNDTHSYNIII